MAKRDFKEIPKAAQPGQVPVGTAQTDIDKYNDVGVFNFLIGESILKSTNINDKIREFLN